MPKSTRYTAEHQGFTFTRNSPRTYTHAVLVQGSVAADRERCERDARHSWHLNLSYHLDRAACRNPLATKYPEQYTPERIEADRAESQEHLDEGEAGFVARALKRFDSYAADRKTMDDGDTYFTCAGWCGRLDLAGKLAGKSVGAVIVEAVTK